MSDVGRSGNVGKKVTGGEGVVHKPLRLSGKNAELGKAPHPRAAGVFGKQFDTMIDTTLSVTGVPSPGSPVRGLYDSLGGLISSTKQTVSKAEKIELELREKFGSAMDTNVSSKLFAAHRNLQEAVTNNLIYGQQILSTVSNVDDKVLSQQLVIDGKKSKTTLGAILQRFEKLAMDFSTMTPANLRVDDLKKVGEEMKELQTLLETQRPKESTAMASGPLISGLLHNISVMISTFDTAVATLENNKIKDFSEIRSKLLNFDEKIESAESDRNKYIATAVIGLAILTTSLLVGLLAMSGVGALVVLIVGGVIGGVMAATGGSLGINETLTVSTLENKTIQDELRKLVDDAAAFLRPLK